MSIAITPKKKPTPRWQAVIEAISAVILRILGALGAIALAALAIVIGLLVVSLVAGGLLWANDAVWGQLQ